MNYLITGYPGFIGRHYISYLHDFYPEITLSGLSKESPDSILLDKTYQLDLNHPGLSAILNEISPDVIIHLASSRFGTLQELFSDNVQATENLIKAAMEVKGKRIKLVIVGSSAEIGWSGNIKLDENVDGHPVDDYGLTKLMQSKLARKYALEDQIDIVRLRFFNILGPGMPDSLLAGKAFNAFKRNIRENDPSPVRFGDLSTARDYVDIRDICRAIDCAVENGKNGELYHIGSGIATTGEELIKMIIEESPAGTKDILHFRSDINSVSGVKLQIADYAKAKKELDWAPSISLKNSVRHIWNTIIADER